MRLFLLDLLFRLGGPPPEVDLLEEHAVFPELFAEGSPADLATDRLVEPTEDCGDEGKLRQVVKLAGTSH